MHIGYRPVFLVRKRAWNKGVREKQKLRLLCRSYFKHTCAQADRYIQRCHPTTHNSNNSEATAKTRLNSHKRAQPSIVIGMVGYFPLILGKELPNGFSPKYSEEVRLGRGLNPSSNGVLYCVYKAQPAYMNKIGHRT